MGMVALGAGLIGARLAPSLIERRLNRVKGVSLTASPETRELHRRLRIVDLHADTLLWDRDVRSRSRRGHVDLPRLRSGNVALQVFSSVSKTPWGMNYDHNDDRSDMITALTIAQRQPVRTWTSLLHRSLHHAAKLERTASRSDGDLCLIRSRGDLDALLSRRDRGDDVVGALFSVEGLHNLEGRIENAAVLHRAGMRMAGLTHFFDNDVAGSMHGAVKGGLTGFGRDVIEVLEALGVTVDLAHASHLAMADVLEVARRPVVVSHGGVQATSDVNRNLTDDELRGVASTGGVVGIGYWPAAIGSLTPAAVVDALEHVLSVCGPGTPALGSDFDGAVTVGWDASDLALITGELLRRGHDETIIAGVMGGNALRVIAGALPAN